MDSTDSRLAEIEATVKMMARQVSRIERVVIGDGDGRALTTRLDRLEQNEKRRAWWLRGAIAILLAVVAERIRSWLP